MTDLNSNVLNDEWETRKRIGNILSFLAQSLSKTLGPYGSNTIVQDRSYNHHLTKDGYSVLKKINTEDDFSSTIIDIVRDISKNLVRTVGDGSTSSIVISNSLFQSFSKFLSEYNVAPKDLVDLLNAVSERFSKDIKFLSTKIDSDNMQILEDIAAVSTNNDRELGRMIREIYEKIGIYGFLSLEKSLIDSDYYEVVSGTEIKRGYINHLFANKEDKRTAEFEMPMVFMANGTLDKTDLEMLVDLIGGICLQLKRPLVLVAKGYDAYVKTFLHENKMKHRDDLEVCAIDIAVESNDSYDKFNDLATFLGATPLDKMSGESFTGENKFPMARLGMCKKSVITDVNTRFLEGAGDSEKIEERIAVIQNEYEKISKVPDPMGMNEDALFNLRKRMANLANSTAVLYVGGKSDVEKENRSFLIEDAIYACQSAIKNGYVIGGNLILPIILSDDKVKEDTINDLLIQFNDVLVGNSGSELGARNFLNSFLETIFDAFSESYKQVLNNANMGREDEVNEILEKCVSSKSILNLKTRKFEKWGETRIINSAETDIEIIRATFSIIGLLLASNQFISINYIK
jgi:chaperonin GroEL